MRSQASKRQKNSLLGSDKGAKREKENSTELSGSELEATNSIGLTVRRPSGRNPQLFYGEGGQKWGRQRDTETIPPKPDSLTTRGRVGETATS